MRGRSSTTSISALVRKTMITAGAAPLMTPVPTMNTAAREMPSELMPSIGTGCASTNVAARRSASTPLSTAALGLDCANENVAKPSSAKPVRATGRRIGSRRAVSRETKRAFFTSPAALSRERTGPTFTVMRYQFAVLPGPPFQVAQKSGQKSGDDGNVHELYLPMQHGGPLPFGHHGRAKYQSGRARPTSPFGVIRSLAPEQGFGQKRPR